MSAALLVAACPAGEAAAELDNDAFRDRVVAFVRDVAAGDPDAPCPAPLIAAEPLQVAVSLYDWGEVIGRGLAADVTLCGALRAATEQAVATSDRAASGLVSARFVVELLDRDYALAEHEGAGVEVIGGLVPTRVLDREGLRRRIDEGQAYLLRVMDPALGGVHKHYDAPTDGFEPRLHTIYTASTIYTLLALYARDRDEGLRAPIERAAGFLRSMQRVAPGQPGHGAFHYSLDLRGGEREPRFVVGTTSKTIFSLIELHAFTGDAGHLDAARLAADWLLSMQGADGRVSSELELEVDGTWRVTERESVLYTGQVLSALSRLYEATGDARYLDGAARTAGRLVAKVEREGCYLGDDYREPNPISSSWAILSLFEFARASDDAALREVALGCADELLERQIDDPDDVYDHGRWRASLSSSGNGWLAEVLAVLDRECPAGARERCDRYRGAAVRLFRLLSQYTYSPENAFVARDPEKARGGVFWNTSERYVRTDSVCHAMNAYVFMIDRLPDGVLVEVPEPPLAERLAGLSYRPGEREGFGGASEEDEARVHHVE